MSDWWGIIRDEGDTVRIYDRNGVVAVRNGLLQVAAAITREQYGNREVSVTHQIFTAQDPCVAIEGQILTFAGRSYIIHGVQAPLERGDLYRLDVEERLDG